MLDVTALALWSGNADPHLTVIIDILQVSGGGRLQRGLHRFQIYAGLLHRVPGDQLPVLPQDRGDPELVRRQQDIELQMQQNLGNIPKDEICRVSGRGVVSSI